MRFHTRNLLGLNVNVKQKQLFIMVMQKAMKKNSLPKGLKQLPSSLEADTSLSTAKQLGMQSNSEVIITLYWGGGREGGNKS